MNMSNGNWVHCTIIITPKVTKSIIRYKYEDVEGLSSTPREMKCIVQMHHIDLV